MFDDPKLREAFATLFNLATEKVYQNNIDHGFWEGKLEDYNKGEKLMLIVTELAEVLEALRHGNPPDDKVPEFSGEAVELADTVIRIMDYCAAYNIDLMGALYAKHEYNKSRPYKHGKKF